MATYALIHGSWGSGWHWAQVPALLRELGHAVVAPDLPCDDPAATFEDYARVVVDALAEVPGDDVVVVGYSLGGQTAALVAAARPVREIVYVAALVPEPGVSLAEQFARGDRLLHNEYLAGINRPDERGVSRWHDFPVYHEVSTHDLDEVTARERYDRCRGQAARPYADPCPLGALPAVPARYVVCAEDRLVDNAHWVPRMEQLGIPTVELPGSHTPMAARPQELVRLLAP